VRVLTAAAAAAVKKKKRRTATTPTYVTKAESDAKIHLYQRTATVRRRLATCYAAPSRSFSPGPPFP